MSGIKPAEIVCQEIQLDRTVCVLEKNEIEKGFDFFYIFVWPSIAQA